MGIIQSLDGAQHSHRVLHPAEVLRVGGCQRLLEQVNVQVREVVLASGTAGNQAEHQRRRCDEVGEGQVVALEEVPEDHGHVSGGLDGDSGPVEHVLLLPGQVVVERVVHQLHGQHELALSVHQGQHLQFGLVQVLFVHLRGGHLAKRDIPLDDGLAGQRKQADLLPLVALLLFQQVTVEDLGSLEQHCRDVLAVVVTQLHQGLPPEKGEHSLAMGGQGGVILIERHGEVQAGGLESAGQEGVGQLVGPDGGAGAGHQHVLLRHRLPCGRPRVWVHLAGLIAEGPLDGLPELAHCGQGVSGTISVVAVGHCQRQSGLQYLQLLARTEWVSLADRINVQITPAYIRRQQQHPPSQCDNQI